MAAKYYTVYNKGIGCPYASARERNRVARDVLKWMPVAALYRLNVYPKGEGK